ncbi:MAG: DUF373 family protein [Thaumarchaeota archaeon]|nr:DUF373 family protein [Nitrososphaerota archaeon]
MSAAAGREQSSLLVMCVDRDDDIGAKTGAVTPIIGREACLTAASKLALADPEEADANAIFAAIKVFDELSAKGYKCEVSLIAGDTTGGFEADQKMRKEMQKVARTFKASGAVLVSDGVEDEKVLPILQGIMPVVSVHRVVIKHSASVEESYAVLGRYLKMLVFDPRYSKWALGVPGILLITSVPFLLFNLLPQGTAIFAGILGIAFLIRAFDIDKMISSIGGMKPSGYIRLFSILASILIIIASLIQGVAAMTRLPEFQGAFADPQAMFESMPKILGVFLGESINFLWAGLGVYFGGTVLYNFLRGSIRVLRDLTGFAILGLLYFPFLQFSLILQGRGSTQLLISFVLFGLSVVFLIIGLIYYYLRTRRKVKG